MSYRPCAGCDSVGASCRAIKCPATQPAHDPAAPEPGTGTREALARVVLRGLRDGWRDDYSAQTVADKVAAALAPEVEKLIRAARGDERG